MNYLKKHKLFTICYTILVILSISLVIFTYHNHSFYKETIAKITSTQEEYISTDTITYGYHEDIYMQTIKAIILNGSDKGQTIIINNEYHQGEAYDQKYQVGDEIFVSLNKKDNRIKNAHIEGYKRDKYIVILIVSFILVIVLVGQLKGFLSIISVLLNIIIFNCLIYINTKGISLPLLSFIGAIIFTLICLTLVSGFNKKTLAAIISSIVGLSVTMLITIIVIHFSQYNGIRFEQMELLTRPYEGIFISEIILGGLGAIMDISISISSSLNELIEKDNHISLKALSKSGINIGKDIMSTMINVLFFTYICTIIPNLTIYFRNGIEISDLISEYISLEMTRALTGAIGITLTIPIAISITLLLYKRRLKQ